jgi:hypothetical protein
MFMLFSYDENDTYFFIGVAVTLDDLEAMMHDGERYRVVGTCGGGWHDEIFTTRR